MPHSRTIPTTEMGGGGRGRGNPSALDCGVFDVLWPENVVVTLKRIVPAIKLFVIW